MSKPTLVFHPEYAPDGIPHFARLAAVAARAAADDLGQFIDAPILDPGVLAGLHDDTYVDAFLRGIEPLASSSHLRWSPALRQACLRMLGGQLVAAQRAREDGVSFNLACGFHHAYPARGGGFCAINGLALVAHHFPAWRVAVLDCDEHGGDGTEAFCGRLPNLQQFSIFGTRFGIRGGTRSRAFAVPRGEPHDADARFLEVVDQCLGELLASELDLVIYQAGMDSHVDDPKSSLKLSTQAIRQRDHRVFDALYRAGLPVLVVLAGAYQRADRVAELYAGTMRAARVSIRRPVQVC
ncbi:MAG: hypothetical protein ABI411_14720 [Tahibacter sp.]